MIISNPKENVCYILPLLSTVKLEGVGGLGLRYTEGIGKQVELMFNNVVWKYILSCSPLIKAMRTSCRCSHLKEFYSKLRNTGLTNKTIIIGFPIICFCNCLDRLVVSLTRLNMIMKHCETHIKCSLQVLPVF